MKDSDTHGNRIHTLIHDKHHVVLLGRVYLEVTVQSRAVPIWNAACGEVLRGLDEGLALLHDQRDARERDQVVRDATVSQCGVEVNLIEGLEGTFVLGMVALRFIYF